MAGAAVPAPRCCCTAFPRHTGRVPPAIRRAYQEQFRDPARVHAICEQYRAAATLDIAHDEADRRTHRLSCPVLALWSAGGAVDTWYDPLSSWRDWATTVTGRAVAGGHFLPEEAPDETTDELLAFFFDPAGAAPRLVWRNWPVSCCGYRDPRTTCLRARSNV